MFRSALRISVICLAIYGGYTVAYGPTMSPVTHNVIETVRVASAQIVHKSSEVIANLWQSFAE